MTGQLMQAWQPLAGAAKAAMPSPRSRDQGETLLGRFVEQAIDAVTATIRPGELDCGFAVERQGRDQIVLRAGATLRGARPVEQTATEVAQLLQQSEEFRALQWRRTADGDVGIHQVSIPMTDESAQRPREHGPAAGNPCRLAGKQCPERCGVQKNCWADGLLQNE